jgi:hypothetical protein
MGLLDEAIREHLDLKRRRGADPSEVDRLEREALGPVRRAPHDAPDGLETEDPVGGGYPGDEEGVYGLDEVPDWADPPEEPVGFDPGAAPLADTPAPTQWEEPPTEIAPAPELDDGTEVRDRPYDQPKHHEIAEEWEAHERQASAAETAGLEPDSPAPLPPSPLPPDDETTSAPESSRPVFGGERQRPVPPEDYDLEQETMEHDVEAENLADADHPAPREGEDVLEETPDFLQDTPDHDRLWFEQRPPRDFDFDD